MPMLRIRGISEEKIKEVSMPLVHELHEIIGCPKDYFTLELIQNTFIMDGTTVNPPTLIEVSWFDRGQEVQDMVTKCITKYFTSTTDCLEVYFITLKENNYYENGKHF
ncbi:MAG: DUF1904 family protein [Cellulosilyticaceae bacterium]